MEVVIVYKGALAYYIINQVSLDVYNASLKRYGGYEYIPQYVTLTRSFRHWTGSIEDVALMDELGRSIDRNFQNDPLFPQRGRDNTVLDNLV